MDVDIFQFKSTDEKRINDKTLENTDTEGAGGEGKAAKEIKNEWPEKELQVEERRIV